MSGRSHRCKAFSTTTISSSPFVFITGASGHIGFTILALLLKKGYRVRVSSRKPATAQKLNDLPSVQLYADRVSFIEVHDAPAENACDEAVTDVDYILHVASPLPDDNHTGTDVDFEKYYNQPAIQGNLGMLRAAQKSPTLKRIVITSPVAILDKTSKNRPLGPDDLPPVPRVEDVSKYPWVAYSASKILSNAAVDDFIKDNKLHFDVVNVLPSYVQGRNEPTTSSRELTDRPSSKQTMIKLVQGIKGDARPSDLIFVDDVAATHVAVHGGQRYQVRGTLHGGLPTSHAVGRS